MINNNALKLLEMFVSELIMKGQQCPSRALTIQSLALLD